MIDKLAWIHLHDGRLLAARSRGRDVWFLPGGKRETGESDAEALTREIREELGVALIPASLRLLGVFEAQAHGQPEGTIVRMTCYTGEAAGEPRASAEIEELAWLSYADRGRVSVVAQMIFDRLRAERMLA